MAIHKVLVVGAGTMGSGIAQACAQSGIRVVLQDVSGSALEKALKTIEWSAGKLADKGRLHEDAASVLARISITTDFSSMADADLAIEAVFEDMALKREILARLDESCPPAAIIASNTSAIPISELASAARRPERVLGLHFFNPVPMMAAVEVISAITTSDETAEAGRRFVLQIGKEPVMVKRDIAGFVINRINFPSQIEAMRLVEAGVATVEDIDKGLRLASGRRMGIFETGDIVGLDVTYGAMMAMYRESGEERFFPPLLLRRKVKAGHLGRKTGKGWYTYDDKGNRIR